MKKYFEIQKLKDPDTECEYYYIKIKKQISEGKILCPRVKLTNKDYINSTSIYDFMQNQNALLGINAGIFNTGTMVPECALMIDGEILFDCKETYVHVNPYDGEEKRSILYILGIKNNGDLKMYPPSYTLEQIKNDGCRDAVMGFIPLIDNYQSFEGGDELVPHGAYKQKPRQVIGQDENQDFFVFTVLAPGMTYEQTRAMLKRHNVPFAYALDGGSSTQTIFDKKRLTEIYRGETGRCVPTAITFEVEDI